MTSASPTQAPEPSFTDDSDTSATTIIRDATPDDMAAIQAIYAHHVLRGTATFEEIPPSVQEMQARLAHIVSLGLPYLLAESNGQIAGYCYASSYRPRAAYRYTLENSIYLAENQMGRGLGKMLLHALINRCEQGPWRQMIAVIAGNNNLASIGLHRSLGFTHAGTQPATGFKFNQWIDVVFMQRALGAGSTTLPDSPAPSSPQP
ncbi:GNAT family N-acetyltransferase [Pollutimonas harenae]|uniref:N-acetyltransferase family protein n=1 Tax=Pollutimonas harenae TaxID=657015 RepID=A0A853H6U0_9BURK|nr:GNAT family N-acetyltransferase [Pollutimonas harenae]NYT86865.1 N-acetyltransferase family protein [Pollutimonas harenae]TEA69418.1 N-acetyltransferase family protein [Pollutimonas harenae]